MKSRKVFNECSSQITKSNLGLEWVNKGSSYRSLPYGKNRIQDSLSEYTDVNVKFLKDAIENKLSSGIRCEFTQEQFDNFGLENEIQYFHYVRVGSPARYFMPLGNIVFFPSLNTSTFYMSKQIPIEKKPVLKTQGLPIVKSLISCSDDATYRDTNKNLIKESFRFFDYWLIIYPQSPSNAPPIQEILLRSSKFVVNSQLTNGIDLNNRKIKFKIVARGRITTSSSRYLNLNMILDIIDVPKPVIQSQTRKLAT